MNDGDEIMARTYDIQVDEEVFRELQRLATPLVDTPNSVLRRILLGDDWTHADVVSTLEVHAGSARPDTFGEALGEEGLSYQEIGPSRRAFAEEAVGPYASLGNERRTVRGMSPRRFGKLLCARAFPGEMFERAKRERGAFRTLFESGERLVYFLNFNKPGATNLWYKLTGTAIEALGTADKPGYIAFTNPAERVAWVIPLEDLDRQHREALGRPLEPEDFDLNIDVRGNRLRELDWTIESYRREV